MEAPQMPVGRERKRHEDNKAPSSSRIPELCRKRMDLRKKSHDEILHHPEKCTSIRKYPSTIKKPPRPKGGPDPQQSGGETLCNINLIQKEVSIHSSQRGRVAQHIFERK